MESKRAATGQFDPQADLDLLKRIKASVAVNDLLDFGPWWYAPLLATCLGGVTLFGRDFGAAINIVYGVVAVGAGLFMAVHDYRRRTVRPKRSPQMVAGLFVVVLLSWVAAAAWGTAVSSIGYEDFVPVPALLAWVLTTVGFLAIRLVGQIMLARRSLVS